jgi:HSP20 family molecular chaperone IbpA
MWFLTDQFFSNFDTSDFASCTKGFPRYEQWVEDDKLVMEFMLAGYRRESLHVDEDGDTLHVWGEKQEGSQSKLRAQRSFSVRLHNSQGTWNLKKLWAKYEDGILRLEIPRSDSKKARSITIQ